MLSKQFFMDMMEVIDAARIFPRLFMILLAALVWDTVQWFQGIPDPNTQQASLLVTVTGIIPVVFNFYVNTGNKWKKSGE